MTEEQEEPQVITCENCSSEIAEDDVLTSSGGEILCPDCYASCERCSYSGNTDEDWSWVDDCVRYCQSCSDRYCYWCERCERTYDGEHVYSREVDGDTWCDHCVDNRATYCEDCDEYTRDEYCRACEQSEQAGRVHNYGYKPNPVFHGTPANKLFMGFELEMELNQTSTSGYHEAVNLVTPLEESDVCYLKSDSSISGTGFELVTHPHTLESYDQATALWDYIEKLRTDYNARSWDTSSCGLHVHVSRTAFRSGAHIHRFLSLVYKNPHEMMKLAGRKNSRYARFNDVYVADDWGIPKFNLHNKIHNPHFTERYSAVNTGNDYTLELRFFRGNMKREGVMSALELCHASVEYTRNLTLSDVKVGALRWDWFTDWVSANNGIYPNLYLRMSKVHMVSLNNHTLINA